MAGTRAVATSPDSSAVSTGARVDATAAAVAGGEIPTSSRPLRNACVAPARAPAAPPPPRDPRGAPARSPRRDAPLPLLEENDQILRPQAGQRLERLFARRLGL